MAFQRRCESMFMRLSMPAAFVDGEGNFLEVNSAFTAHCEPAGKNLCALFPEVAESFRRAALGGLLASAQAQRLENFGHGISSWDWSIQPADGEGGVFWLLQDATGRKLREETEELLSAINREVLAGCDLSSLLHFICAKVSAIYGMQLSWVGKKEENGTIRPVAACCSREENCIPRLSRMGKRWDGGTLGPAGHAIRTGKTDVYRKGDKRLSAWQEAISQLGFSAAFSIPLVIRGDIWGAFSLFSTREDAFDCQLVVDGVTALAARICVLLEAAMDQQQLRLLGAALQDANNGVVITDREGRVRWANKAFSGLSGYRAEEVEGLVPRFLAPSAQDEVHSNSLWATILAGETWKGEAIERRRDGSHYTVWQTISPIRGEGGEITHFVAVHEDITARKKAEDHIRYMAQYDTLTGLPNRVLFFEQLRQSMAQAKRRKSHLALFFMDMDRFKEVNDCHGHHVGDRLLAEVGKRLRECVRESDSVARLAGDEFTVILNDIAGAGDSALIAEKIIDLISRPFMIEGRLIEIGMSIGIAEYHGDAESEDALLQRADAAMYAAKKAGRNVFRHAGMSPPWR